MTVSAHDAHEYPIYNARYRVIFPILDADGDLVTGATTPDTELSQDSGTFADATNEATELATSSGIYYVDLIATEMDTKSTVVLAKSATAGAKSTVLTLHPRRLPVVRTGTAQAGANSTITLDSGASAIDDFYNGAYVNITNNSPANALGQARRIIDYVGSTKVATIEGTWGTNPSSASTFEILDTPESRIMLAGTVRSVTNAGIPNTNVTQFGGSNGTFAAGIPEASLTTSAINAVADQVWDEAQSGHVTSGSFGAALSPTDHGTAAAGGAATITLRAGAVATNDYYNKQKLRIVAGTGAGQSEYIDDYDGPTKVATMAAAWATQPDNTSVYVIDGGGTIPGASAPTASEVADAVWDEARSGHTTAGTFGEALTKITGTAQTGAAGSITLAAGELDTNDRFKYSVIRIIGGTGAGQSRQCSAYNGTSKVATVSINWTITPDNTSVYEIVPLGVDAATVAAIADAVWDEARAGHATAGSFGEYTFSDVVRISGDATSADNLESYTDGTAKMPVDVTAISGDTTSADNLEAYTDGTTPMPVNVTAVSGDATAADNLEAALDGTGSVTITADITGDLSGSVGSVTGAVGSVAGSVASLGAQAKADVNAEVLDVLNTDTFAEPGQGAPAATTTLAAKINYLYKMLRNKKTVTGTTFSLFNDAGDTVDQKATISDAAGTTTHGELVTGP